MSSVAKAIRSWSILFPALLVLAIFFLCPFAHLLGLSITQDGGFGLGNYVHSFEQPPYLKNLYTSVGVSTLVVLFTLVLGYPCAIYMVRTKSAIVKTILYVLVLSPLLTGAVVRAFAWMVIFQQNGLINYVLMSLGLISQPIRMMWKLESVILALTHLFLPLMILPLVSALLDIDPNLELAAQNLGAGRLKTFSKITLPLSMPGVIAGSILVYVLCVGTYVTPLLVGGPQQPLLSISLYLVTLTMFDFPLSGALSSLLLCVSLFASIALKRIIVRILTPA